jgi:hypothetical protein
MKETGQSEIIAMVKNVKRNDFVTRQPAAVKDTMG